jgi:hypothetical protein
VKRAWLYIGIVVAAVVVAVSTLAITPSVRRDGLRGIEYGYPFHFARSNADWLTPPRGVSTGVPFNPRDNPIQFGLGMFLASVALVAAFFLSIELFIRFVGRRDPAPA